MRNLRRTLLALILIATAPCLGQAQDNGASPAGKGPSLGVTMRFIQQKLSGVGTIRYTMHLGPNISSTTSIGFSKISADANNCVVRYLQTGVDDNQPPQEVDLSISFRTAKDIVVEPLEMYFAWQRAQQGLPNLTSQVTPSVTALLVRTDHTITNLLFLDPDTADRVAKAMTHAIELCGGGNHDPF
jgi:hypothetical protein